MRRPACLACAILALLAVIVLGAAAFPSRGATALMLAETPAITVYLPLVAGPQPTPTPTQTPTQTLTPAPTQTPTQTLTPAPYADADADADPRADADADADADPRAHEDPHAHVDARVVHLGSAPGSARRHPDPGQRQPRARLLEDRCGRLVRRARHPPAGRRRPRYRLRRAECRRHPPGRPDPEGHLDHRRLMQHRQGRTVRPRGARPHHDLHQPRRYPGQNGRALRRVLPDVPHRAHLPHRSGRRQPVRCRGGPGHGQHREPQSPGAHQLRFHLALDRCRGRDADRHADRHAATRPLPRQLARRPGTPHLPALLRPLPRQPARPPGPPPHPPALLRPALRPPPRLPARRHPRRPGTRA